MLIETIDCDYTLPRYAAAYLLIHDGRATFIENNTAYAVPRMLDRLLHHGLSPEAVEYCVITHVHLDHAGGSSALMKACPRAQFIAHPRAAPHAIDPTKLVNSAKSVYGEERFKELYGVIEGIDKDRVLTMEDEATLDFAGYTLRFLHTRGHANHHFVIHIPEKKAIFTGDAFGIIYPDVCINKLFAFPSTSPTDFDGPCARSSIDRIIETNAEIAYLTHYGPIRELKEAGQQLRYLLSISEDLMLEAYASPEEDEELETLIRPALRAHFEAAMDTYEVPKVQEVLDRLALDIELNAQGLAFAAVKKRRKDRAHQAAIEAGPQST